MPARMASKRMACRAALRDVTAARMACGSPEFRVRRIAAGNCPRLATLVIMGRQIQGESVVMDDVPRIPNELGPKDDATP